MGITRQKATQEFLSRSLDQFAIVAVGVIAVAIVTSQDVVVLLASRKFAKAHELLPYLVIGLVLSAVTIYFRPGLLIHKKGSKIATATLGASILNVGLNILLLPRIGLVGAAIATTVSYAGIVVFLAYQSLSVLPFKIEVIALVRYSLTGFLVSWLGTFVHVVSPVLNVVARGGFILALYTLILWGIDSRVRVWMRQVHAIVMGRVQRQAASRQPESPEQNAAMVSAVSSPSPITGNALPANPDIDRSRGTVMPCI